MKTDMEKSLEASGKIPRIVQVMYFKDVPRSSANQQPEQSLPQVWEAQWQQFLNTVQHSHAGWGNPQLSEVVPWDDTEAFLAAFEQVAEACRWPREEWVGHLMPALRGGMEQVYCRLDPRERGDYGKVKAALLRGDAMRAESKRQHFRQCNYQELEGPRRIYGRLQDLCRQWLKPDHHSKEQIMELIIQEQLLAMLPPEIQNWVRECAPKDCIELVALAEDFLMGRHAAQMWKWPVPLQQITVNSLEAEGPLAEATARQHYTGICQSREANERMSTRNAGFMIPPDRREMPGVSRSEGRANLKDRSGALERNDWAMVNPDQKPLHWEVAQGNCGNCNSSEELLVPTPDILSQPNQEGGVFYITETGQTVTTFLPESRPLGEIKVENYEDAYSEAGDSYDALTEDSSETVPSSPKVGEESPRRKLRPREPQEGKQAKSVPQGPSKKLRKKGGALAASKRQKEKKHKCAVCGHCTYYLSDLLRHMNAHSGKRPFRCSDCGTTFSKLTSFEAHQKIHVPARRLRPLRKALNCPGKGSKASSAVSEKRMTTSSTPAKSLDIHAGGGPHTCHDCTKSFIWVSSLFRHWRQGDCQRNQPRQVKRKAVEEIKPHSRRERPASKCRLVSLLEKSPEIRSQTALASSRLRPRKPQDVIPEPSEAKCSEVQDRRKYECLECGRRYTKISVLDQHMRVHTGEKPFACPKCDRTFRWSSNFRAHRRKCCAKRPAPQTPLAENEATNTDDEQPCKVKQEEIKSEDEFGMWPIDPPGAFEAPLSEQRNDLQDGGLEESDPPGRDTSSTTRPEGYSKRKKYPCLECGLKFETLSDMFDHNSVHTGEKLYKCHDCGETFRWALKLSEHQKTHKGDQKEPAASPILAECDVILEDEEELIHTVERSFKKEGTNSSTLLRTLPEDAASGNREYCKARAATKLHPRLRGKGRQGVSAQYLKTAAVAKKSVFSQKERKHKCNVCGHRTFYLSDLLRHMSKHTKDHPFKCLECGKAYTQKSALIFHQRSHLSVTGSSSRKSLVKRGPRSRKRIHKLAGLVKPAQSLPDEKPFKCNECGLGFRWGSNLSRHRKIHYRDRKNPLAGNQRMHAGHSKPNKMVLENSSQVKATLKRTGGTSMEITRGVASVTVVMNDGGWKSKNHPNKKLAEGNLVVKEAVPAGKFLHSKSRAPHHYKSGFVTHQKSLLKNLYQCGVCSKTFSKESQFVDHGNTHTGAKPYKCDECGRCFGWKDKWSQHMRMHAGVKPYQCPECKKHFFRKDNLMIHLQSHSSSYSYQCLQCGKKFSDRDQLFRHQRVHMGQKPYECEECGQGFSRKDSWIKHQQQHAGEK